MQGEDEINLEYEACLVQQEIATIIDCAKIAPPLKEGALWQLSQKGKSLYVDRHVCRSVLPLLVCEAICGSNRHAVPVAASVELIFAAGDVFDDIQDHESEGSLVGVLGPEKALNVAVVLLMLGQRAVLNLREQGVNADTMVSVMESLPFGVLQSCSGQHWDLAYEMEQDVSEESYLEMIGLKTGAMVEMACRVGAILATNDLRAIANYGQFGWNLGMAAQIINDIWSIGTSRWSGSDISKKKKTLPIIFTFNHADKEQRRLLEYVYNPKTVVTQELQQEASRVVMASGGVHYSVVKIETYKQRAANAIEIDAADSRLLALLYDSLSVRENR